MNKTMEQRLRKQLEMIKSDAKCLMLKAERAIDMLDELRKPKEPLTKEELEKILQEEVTAAMKNLLFEKIQEGMETSDLQAYIKVALKAMPTIED